MKILNTINPVTRAFTVKERTSPVTFNPYPQSVLTMLPEKMYNEPLYDNQVPRGNKIKINQSNRIG